MKVMFVSSTGGHLSELLHWSQRLDPEPEQAVWVTHDRSNAAQIALTHPGARVHFVRPVEPKQAGVALAMLPTARRLLRRERPDAVVTTGAAVAVPFAVAARAAGVAFHYVESAARVRAPSLAGRLVSRWHPRTMWCQLDSPWPGWRPSGSVFDPFQPVPGAIDPQPVRRVPGGSDPQPVRRVVVALGTQADFGFRRAVEAVAAALDALGSGPQVLWQVGSTDLRGLDLPGARAHVPEPELVDAMRAADVVITHAGVGLATLALECGHAPVLVPRRAARGEHTDDHQLQLAAFLAGRGLAFAVEAPALDADTLRVARPGRVERRPDSSLSRLQLR